MPKALVCYFSKTGNVQKMAEIIANTLNGQGISVILKSIDKVELSSLTDFDCILLGSPTTYGSMAWPVKQFIDKSVELHGELKGKVGGAFTSCAYLGGGNESTLMSILKAFMIHGMIIQGNPIKNYFGPVCLGAPDNISKVDIEEYAKNISVLLKRLFPKET
jgi:NAD(P)H dehydrogenase (quinone)